MRIARQPAASDVLHAAGPVGCARAIHAVPALYLSERSRRSVPTFEVSSVCVPHGTHSRFGGSEIPILTSGGHNFRDLG